MSLLTPPLLLVKSGQWKLFLVSVCQTPPWDYQRSGRVCLVNVFSLISIEAYSVQKPVIRGRGNPHSRLQTDADIFSSTGLCLWANLFHWDKPCLKMTFNWYVFIWKVKLGRVKPSIQHSL